MNLKHWLVVVFLVSAAVFTAGVFIEQAAEPGSSETVLGVNPESPGLVTAGVVLSVFLAAAIFRRPGTLVLSIAGMFGLIFAFFDALEIFHQFQEGRPSIMAVAAIAALFHLAITALAIILLRRGSAGQRTAS